MPLLPSQPASWKFRCPKAAGLLARRRPTSGPTRATDPVSAPPNGAFWGRGRTSPSTCLASRYALACGPALQRPWLRGLPTWRRSGHASTLPVPRLSQLLDPSSCRASSLVPLTTDARLASAVRQRLLPLPRLARPLLRSARLRLDRLPSRLKIQALLRLLCRPRRLRLARLVRLPLRGLGCGASRSPTASRSSARVSSMALSPATLWSRACAPSLRRLWPAQLVRAALLQAPPSRRRPTLICSSSAPPIAPSWTGWRECGWLCRSAPPLRWKLAFSSPRNLGPLGSRRWSVCLSGTRCA